MKTKRWIGVTCLAAFLASPLWAEARLESSSNRLLIFQKLDSWELLINGEVIASDTDLTRMIEISIENGDTLDIRIVDQNPLLYTYTKEIETTDTDDFYSSNRFRGTIGKSGSSTVSGRRVGSGRRRGPNGR